MGRTIRLACRSCDYERVYQVGAGLLHDPLTPVGVTSGIASKQVQDEILLLLEKEAVSGARASRALYYCRHCRRFHEQLSVEVRHRRGTYRNRCRCPRCNRSLEPWEGNTGECPCPRCGELTLALETIGEWS